MVQSIRCAVDDMMPSRFIGGFPELNCGLLRLLVVLFVTPYAFVWWAACKLVWSFGGDHYTHWSILPIGVFWVLFAIALGPIGALLMLIFASIHTWLFFHD